MAYEMLDEPIPQEQSLGKSVARAPVVAAGNVGAWLPGQFGDLAKLAYTGTNKLTSLFGAKGPEYEQSYLGKILPPTQQHLKNLQEGMPFLKPRNKIEKFGSDLISDTASLYFGARSFGAGRNPRMAPYLPTPMRAAAISLGANTLGKGVELTTGSSSKGDTAKHGAMFGLSLWSPQNARGIVNELYAAERAALPQNASANANRFQNSLNAMRNDILQGRPRGNASPQRRWLLDKIDQFENLIQNGAISINQLKEQIKDLHSEMDSMGLFHPLGRVQRDIRNYANRLRDHSQDVFEAYGRQNPRWLDAYRSANTAHGAVEQSNVTANVIQRMLHGRAGRSNELLSTLFEFGGAGLLAKLFPSLGGTTAAAYQAVKIGYRMFRSPELFDHYSRVIRTAIKSDPRQAERDPKLYKELKSFEKKIKKMDASEKGKYQMLD